MQAQALMRKAARAKEDPEEEADEDPDEKYKDEANDDDPPKRGKGRGKGRGTGRGKGRGRGKKRVLEDQDKEESEPSKVTLPADQQASPDRNAQHASPKPKTKKRKAEKLPDKDQKGHKGVENNAAPPAEDQKETEDVDKQKAQEREGVEEKAGEASPSSVQADRGEATPKKMPKKPRKKTPLKGRSPMMIKGALETKTSPKDWNLIPCSSFILIYIYILI